MYKNLDSATLMPGVPTPYPGTCWACGRETTFQPLAATIVDSDFYDNRHRCKVFLGDAGVQAEGKQRVVGWRYCSNPECQALVAIARDAWPDGTVQFHPAPGIAYAKAGIPPVVVAALDEAIDCFRIGAYRGAAALVRRTVELVCADQGATTGMLDAKIKALAAKGNVAHVILNAMTDIKFLGNDALHVETREFGLIDEQTVAVAIQVAIRCLENLYQAEEILSALKRLRKL